MTSLEPPLIAGVLLSPWILSSVTFVSWVVLLSLIKRVVFVWIRRRVAARPELIWGNAFLDALSPALLIFIWTSGIAILARMMPLTRRWGVEVTVGLDAAVVIALIIFFDRWAPALMEWLAGRSPAVKAEYSLIRGITRTVIIALGALMLLDTIGISITPLLASLGVGSVAVALALQDTLANLFAGIYIAADKPIAPGDFVRLETGQEGYMVRLGWRSSHIRMVPEGAVVVPNQKLATSVLTNFSLPNGEIVNSIDFGVAANGDLERVETVTLEVAREVTRTIEGGALQSEPSVRFQGFAGPNVKLTVALWSRTDAAAIRHEFIKRLRSRYEREGIILA